MPGYSVPFVHSGDPGYAPPVLRAPSPTDSIGTDYGPDETSPDEDSLSDAEFARMCQQRLGLGDMRPDEMKSNFDPLLPKPKDEDEERVLYQQVLHHLRVQVQRLQEDHLFEQTLLRGSVVADEQQPTSHDIDTILQSMMGPSQTPATRSPTTYTSTSRTPSTRTRSTRTPATTGHTPLSVHGDFMSPEASPSFLDFPSPGIDDVSMIFPEPTTAMMPQSSSTPAINRRVTRNMTRTGHR